MSNYFLKLLDEAKNFKEKNNSLMQKELKKVPEDENSSGQKIIEKYFSIIKKIGDELVYHPGQLITLSSNKQKEDYKTELALARHYVDDEEIFDSAIGGRNTDLLFFILDDYIKKSLKLTPSFINIKYNQAEFEPYFNEALKAWAHGLNTAALLMIHSILEETIRLSLYESHSDEIEYLYEKVNKYDVRPSKKFRMWDLTQLAISYKLISKNEGRTIEEITQTRNNATHQLKHIGGDSEKVLEYIQFSIGLVEKLFGNP